MTSPPAAANRRNFLRGRSRQVLCSAAVAGSFAVLGVSAVLAGTPRSAETPRTSGTIVLQDTFTRRDNAARLGDSRNGPRWRATVGTWGTLRGHAYTSRPALPASIATVATPGHDTTISVTLDPVATNAGLVFRYVDPTNYWAVLAAPDHGTWKIVKVIRGKTIYVGNLGLVPGGARQSINVAAHGEVLEFWSRAGAQASVPKRVAQPTLIQATMAGLIAIGPESKPVRFENFVISR